MFTTHRAAEMLLDLGPEYADRQIWAFIEQEIIWPWFYVGVVRGRGRDQVTSMLMLPHAQDLQQLLKASPAAFRVESVSLVSPPHINGSEEWCMEPLLELNTINYEGTDEHGFLYVVAGGETYIVAPEGKSGSYRVIEQIFSSLSLS
ncbi:hypothetical protein [Pseudomonas sichuanensis]|uniref:hypothetical protein n=1 Tax=Pseudomonas sichuanensis TaxID=2213015 RepID=UPI00215E856F|nr:hypothetical protein [Pseudomonas sichuanensis]UVL89469.1 hypothetical protein LOY51_00755 [Pseudomonas sichuanensis]